MKIKANRTVKSKVERIDNNSNVEDRTTFFYYAFRNILLVSLPLLIISGFVLSHLSFHSSATDGSSGSGSTDSFTVSISSACTISSVVNSIHNIETNVGTYVADVGKTTIKTLCNDGNGYAIYANGYSNNEEGNNKLINSSYPQYSIDTGLATSGLTSAWAMKLNNIENDPSPTPPSIDSSYNDTYGLVPTQWTKVAYRQSGTTDMSEGSSFTTTYSVYASSSQYNGTYNGQVKYVLLHPYKNDSTITNVPTFEESFVLAGKEKVTVDGADYYKMQDMNSSICGRVANTEETPTIQLADIRDNKVYWVTKLADGHCWMTQNLDLDLDSSKTLSSLNTDLNVSYSNNQYTEYNSGYSQVNNIIYWEPANNTINFSGSTMSGWSTNNYVPYSASKTDNTETGHASLGNWYSWTAAIASNDSSALTSDTINNISQNPQNSICPKGWRLPTISNQSETITGSTNEFARLNYLYNNNSSSVYTGLVAAPIYFVASGLINEYNIFNLLGINGYFQSSSLKDSGYSYRLQMSEGNGRNVSNSYWRYLGLSVRCVAR